MISEFLQNVEKGKLIKFVILLLIFGGYAIVFAEGIKFKVGLLFAAAIGIGIAVFGGKTIRKRR